VIPQWAGVVQMVALPPLDLFADVRVLMADAPSRVVFAVGVAASVGARTVVFAALLGFSRRSVGFVVRFYLAALPFAIVAAGLDFTGRAVLYAYLVWLATLVTILSFLVLGASPWMGAESLRDALGRALRWSRRLGVLVAYLIVLALVGSLVPARRAWVAVALVPLSALMTAAAAWRLERAPRSRNEPTRPRPAPARVAAALVALGLTVASAPGETNRALRARTGSLFVVAGVDTSSGDGSMFRLDPRALGYRCSQTFYFSYAGAGNGARRHDATCPIVSGAPYHEADTTRPLRALVATFADQVAPLPRPVVVVTHSQGAWIARAAVAAGRAAGVSRVVMLGAFAENLAAYPPRGESAPGVVGGDVVRLVTGLGRAVGVSSFDADAPLARELQATPGAIESLFDQPLPRRVSALAVLSKLDLPLVPDAWLPGVTESCPGWSLHRGLPTSRAVMETARRFLDGRDVGSCSWWARALARPVTAFGIPPPTAP
jgi:hypothetical protein